MAVLCPECDNTLALQPDEVDEGETIECDECGASIEVIGTDPIQLAAIDDAGYDDEEQPRPIDEEQD